MNDDEVPQWLRQDGDAPREIVVWNTARFAFTIEQGPSTIATLQILRSLAETRKAYARLCVREGLCPGVEWEKFVGVSADEAEAFFLAMPRPR